MTFRTHEPSDEAHQWSKLATASSLTDAVARYVHDLARIPSHEAPEWLTALAMPKGWHLARFERGDMQPLRIAVYNPPPPGEAYGCETLDIFRFTGTPSAEVVLQNVDCTLRDLHAEHIMTRRLATPPKPGVVAARSSGHFSTGGLRVWAQYSSYLAGSGTEIEGLLIQHGIFADSSSLPILTSAITQLSDAVHQAFTGAVDTD